MIGWVPRRAGEGPTLRRREAEPGGAESAQQHPTLHHLGTGTDQNRAEFLGDVVVVTLETSPRDAVRVGEGMQFVQRVIAHQVAPSPTPIPPAGFVHQDRHVPDTGTLGP